MKKILVDGRAGCGKTTYIVKTLLDYSQEFNIDNSLVFVFTNASKSAFKQRLNSFKTVFNSGKIRKFKSTTIHKYGTKDIDTKKYLVNTIRKV